jgi:hypothetical protein
MNHQNLDNKISLTIHEAALLMVSETLTLSDAEVLLSQAVDRKQLPASIMRWASEQWDGERLEGNIDRTRTLIERQDMNAWLARTGRGT